MSTPDESSRDPLPRSGSVRRRIASAALLVISLGVALLGAELVVRLTIADEIVLFPRYHAAARYGEYTLRRLRPDSTFWHTSADGRWKFETNSRGFREIREFDYDKPQGLIRILSLGDSHTQGFEVRQEQTFSAVAQRCLRARGIRAEVINTGISGFSTAEELVFLEQEGVRYDPDFVVVGFYGNDFRDNVKAGLFDLEHGELVVRERKHTPGVRVLAVHNEIALLRWLSEHSYLYSLALNTAWETAKKLLQLRSVAEYAIPVGAVENFQQDLVMALFERMRRFTREKGIRLVVLDIPRLPENGRLVSSVADDLAAGLAANSDAFLHSRDVLGDTQDLSQLHVPHGHRHISEYTHRAFGAAIAERIAAALAAESGRASATLPAECRNAAR